MRRKMGIDFLAIVLSATLIVYEPILAFLYGYGVPTAVYVSLGGMLIVACAVALAVLAVASIKLFAGLNTGRDRRANAYALTATMVALLAVAAGFTTLRGPSIVMGARARVRRSGGEQMVDVMHAQVFGSGPHFQKVEDDEGNAVDVPAFLQKIGGRKAWFLKGSRGNVLIVQSELPHRSGWFVVRSPDDALHRIDPYSLHMVSPVLYRY